MTEKPKSAGEPRCYCAAAQRTDGLANSGPTGHQNKKYKKKVLNVFFLVSKNC